LPSDNHKVLTELAALYCRARWYLWPIAIESVGPGKRNLDVIAIRSKHPQGIVGLEAKATYDDFKKGIKKGQFKPSQYITEMWLVYPGNFPVNELPREIGILRTRSSPICVEHDFQNAPNLCIEGKCKRKKNIFLFVERPAKSFWDRVDQSRIYQAHREDWLWSIATSNASKLIGYIEANACWQEEG